MFFIRRFKRYLRRRELDKIENRITFLEEHIRIWSMKIRADNCMLDSEANQMATWRIELINARKRQRQLIGW